DQPPAVPADDGEVDGVRVAPAGAVLDRHRGAVPGLLLELRRQHLDRHVVGIPLDEVHELRALLVPLAGQLVGHGHRLPQGVAVTLGEGLDVPDGDLLGAVAAAATSATTAVVVVTGQQHERADAHDRQHEDEHDDQPGPATAGPTRRLADRAR